MNYYYHCKATLTLVGSETLLSFFAYRISNSSSLRSSEWQRIAPLQILWSLQSLRMTLRSRYIIEGSLEHLLQARLERMLQPTQILGLCHSESMAERSEAPSGCSFTHYPKVCPFWFLIFIRLASPIKKAIKYYEADVLSFYWTS